ncbi:MAG: hypothetical protein PWR08_1207, partial [Thermoanaerobacterium sp.]|nr:hypothetical protein [Thermoanaerobacterium sp.]
YKNTLPIAIPGDAATPFNMFFPPH